MFLFNEQLHKQFSCLEGAFYFAGDTARIFSVPRIDSPDWFWKKILNGLQHDNNLPSCKISMSESLQNRTLFGRPPWEYAPSVKTQVSPTSAAGSTISLCITPFGDIS